MKMKSKTKMKKMTKKPSTYFMPALVMTGIAFALMMGAKFMMMNTATSNQKMDRSIASFSKYTSYPKSLARHYASHPRALVSDAASYPKSIIKHYSSYPGSLVNHYTSYPKSLVNHYTSYPRSLVRHYASHPRSLVSDIANYPKSIVKHALSYFFGKKTGQNSNLSGQAVDSHSSTKAHESISVEFHSSTPSKSSKAQ